jgi:hypothetical protein
MDGTFSISAFPDQSEIKERCDSRLTKFIDGWQLKSIYEGTTVDIPGFEGSIFNVIKYFQVIKKEGEPFYREDERDNEIGMTLWAHWPGYDHECEVNLFIAGKDVLNGTNKVSAEILKCGGADMELLREGRLITNFKTKHWWPKPINKIWIPDLDLFLS